MLSSVIEVKKTSDVAEVNTLLASKDWMILYATEETFTLGRHNWEADGVYAKLKMAK